MPRTTTEPEQSASAASAALMAAIGETGDWARRRWKGRRHPPEKRDTPSGPLTEARATTCQ
ncbi:hypothetical protein DBP18_27620 [Streptomyces sp. CS081A]|nr:hypothetical protein DBP18_27620 [Streptomyces sp. CS081A]